MSVNEYNIRSKGSQTDDGFRSSQVQQPSGGARGSFMSPFNLYSLVPVPTSVNNLSVASTPVAAGNLTLAAGTGVKNMGLVVNGGGFAGYDNVMKLDCNRCISFVGTSVNTSATATVYGWSQASADQPPVPLISTVTIPTGSATTVTLSAFRYVRQIAISGTIVSGTVSVGTSNTFGLPYRVDTRDFMIPYLSRYDNRYTLGTNPLTPNTTAGTSTEIVVAYTGRARAVGDFVTISGATLGTGLPVEVVNGRFSIIAVTAGTSFTIKSGVVAGDTTPFGGTAVVITFSEIADNGVFAAADLTTPVSATTGDVRGTYTPTVTMDGTVMLNMYIYPQGSDCSVIQSKYWKALALNPITTGNTSTTISIYLPNHGATAGDCFNIRGAAAANSITAAQLNVFLTVLAATDSDNFTSILPAGTSGGAPGSGGGASVSLRWTMKDYQDANQSGNSVLTLYGNTPYAG